MSYDSAHCLRVIRRIAAGARTEINEVEDAVEYLTLQSPPLVEGDQDFVRNLAVFARYFGGYNMNGEDAWQWHMGEILAGAYPLESLPDHVRSIAKELYYKTAGRPAR